MPPFEKGGAYCFAHVGRYVGRYVGRSVCRYPLTLSLPIFWQICSLSATFILILAAYCHW